MITPSDSCAVKDEGRSSDASVVDCNVNGVMVWGQDRFGRYPRTLWTSLLLTEVPTADAALCIGAKLCRLV